LSRGGKIAGKNGLGKFGKKWVGQNCGIKGCGGLKNWSNIRDKMGHNWAKYWGGLERVLGRFNWAKSWG